MSAQSIHLPETNSPWIGDLPQGWNLHPIKRTVSTPITDGPHETPELSDDGIQFVSAEAIKNNRIDFNRRRGYISEELHQLYSRKCKPQRNDIFIVKSGATTGNVAYVDVDFEFNIWSPLALVRCRPNIAHYKFLYYQLQSDSFRKQVELSWSFGTQENIGMGVLGRIKAILPPLPEQKRIAAYLDASCAAIDRAVATKQKQLETLDALRKSIIQRAVTQGLNPKVKMKDHGVAMYGLAPAAWRKGKLRYEIQIANGKFASDKIVDDGSFPIFGGNGVMARSDEWNTEPPFIVIGRVGAYCGNAHFVNEKAWVSDNAMHVTTTHHPQFLAELFTALDFNSQANNTAQPVITGTKIKNTYVLLPPRTEQAEIYEFVCEQRQRFAVLTKNLKSQIATLTAYRKSLIHECVTGKRRISEADVAKVEAHV